MHAQAYTQKQWTQMSSFGPCMYFEIAWVIIAYCWHLCAGIVVVPRSWVSEGEARQGQRWWPLIPGQSRRWSKQMTLPNTSKMGRWGRGRSCALLRFFILAVHLVGLSCQGKSVAVFMGLLVRPTQDHGEGSDPTQIWSHLDWFHSLRAGRAFISSCSVCFVHIENSMKPVPYIQGIWMIRFEWSGIDLLSSFLCIRCIASMRP